MENKKIFGILAAVVMVLTAVGFTAAQSLPDGFPVFHGFGMFGFGMGINQTAAQEMWSAITDNNYTAWVASIESQLTQANFDRLVNMTQEMNKTRDRDFNWTNMTGNWTMPSQWKGNWTGNWTDSDHPGFRDMNQTWAQVNGTYNGTNPMYGRFDGMGDRMRAMRNPGFFKNQDD